MSLSHKIVSLLGAALLAGCASAPPATTMLQWTPLSNAQAQCAGEDYCVQHGRWKDAPLCTLVTPAKAVSYAALGRLAQQCFARSAP